MSDTKAFGQQNRAVSICGYLTGGALLSALPFVISGAYVAKSPDLGVAPALCIGTAFLVGLGMIINGLSALWVAFKEYDDRDTDSACF
jgi:hypothetical protein